MDDKRRDALQVIGDDVGLDLVGIINAQAKVTREIADEKVEHKEMKTEEKTEDIVEVTEPIVEDVSPDEKEVTEDATSAAEVQATEIPTVTDADAIVDAIVDKLGLKALSDMIQAQTDAVTSLQSRMDKLEITDEKKIAEKVETEVPRYAGFSWLQASKSESTVLTPEEEVEFKDKRPNSGAGNSKAANLISGLYGQ